MLTYVCDLLYVLAVNNVEWDAVELPSQFMENWCYDKPTLYGFAKHFQTGEPLPDELFQKIKASKNFQAGLAMLRQLFFGSMDMQLHSEKFDPFGTQTPFEVHTYFMLKYLHCLYNCPLSCSGAARVSEEVYSGASSP